MSPDEFLTGMQKTILPYSPASMSTTREWLKTHNLAPYHGMWIAVRNGILLGHARMLKDLLAVAAANEDPLNTLLTKVLPPSNDIYVNY